MDCAKCNKHLHPSRRSIWASDGKWYHKACQPIGTYGLQRNPPDGDEAVMVRVTGLAETPTIDRLVDVLRDNAHDDEVVQALHKLWPPGSRGPSMCQIGGGAAPLVRIERLN